MEPHSGLPASSHGLLTRGGDDVHMTLTIAIILNAVLMAGLLVALAHVMHLPFRLKHHVAEEQPAERFELERAA